MTCSRPRLGVPALLLIVGLATGPTFAQAPPTNDVGDARRDDLALLMRELEANHPNLYAAHPPSIWATERDAIAAEAERLSDGMFYLRLSRLVSLAEDGHTGILPPFDMLHDAWPLAWTFVGDDLVVVAAEEARRGLVGRRVTSIGGAPTDRAVETLLSFVGSDSIGHARERITGLLRYAPLQRALGWIAKGETPWLEIEVDGVASRVALESGGDAGFRPLPPHAPTPAGWVGLAEAHGFDPPLWQQRVGDAWWYTTPGDDDANVYVGFNRVEDDPDETFASFVTRLFAHLEATGTERLVIDLRHNSGGNGYLNQPLIHAIVRSEHNVPGRLYVLTAPRTFSAAVMGAADLERETHAIFVGAPTGAGPAHFGDAIGFTLPNSDMLVRCSTVYHQFSDGRDRRRFIAPDIPVVLTIDDLRRGHDPVLETALEHEVADPAALARWPPMARWMRPSQADVPARRSARAREGQ